MLARASGRPRVPGPAGSIRRDRGWDLVGRRDLRPSAACAGDRGVDSRHPSALADLPSGIMPIMLGGDHAMAAGILPAMAARATRAGRPFFVLWLDAHTDCHTLDTSVSGNLHGVPIAYAVNAPSFAGAFPPLPAVVRPENICMMGIRSIDPAERAFLSNTPHCRYDMRAIDEHGVAPLLTDFLDRVRSKAGICMSAWTSIFLIRRSRPEWGRQCRVAPPSGRRITSWRSCTTVGW